MVDISIQIIVYSWRSDFIGQTLEGAFLAEIGNDYIIDNRR